jgi:hypothetical protein
MSEVVESKEKPHAAIGLGGLQNKCASCTQLQMSTDSTVTHLQGEEAQVMSMPTYKVMRDTNKFLGSWYSKIELSSDYS